MLFSLPLFVHVSFEAFVLGPGAHDSLQTSDVGAEFLKTLHHLLVHPSEEGKRERGRRGGGEEERRERGRRGGEEGEGKDRRGGGR